LQEHVCVEGDRASAQKASSRSRHVLLHAAISSSPTFLPCKLFHSHRHDIPESLPKATPHADN